MEMVLFTGIQGSGKSHFFKERFFHTHVRISRDLLNTKNREQKFIETCLQTKQRFVVDNTNVRREERALYIALAKASGFRVVGYFFITEVRLAVALNEKREGKQKIPKAGLFGTLKRLEPPKMEEGFDELFTVQLTPENQFVVIQTTNEHE